MARTFSIVLLVSALVLLTAAGCLDGLILMSAGLEAMKKPAKGWPPPPTPVPAEFVPGHRLQAGTTLRYRVRISASGSTAGPSTAGVSWDKALAEHVVSVDPQGIASIRIEVDEKPLALLRVHQNGQVLEAQALSPEPQEFGIQEWAGMGLAIDHTMRVADTVPLRLPVPKAAGLPPDAELIGTGIFLGFSPLGQCWAGEVKGTARLNLSKGAVLTDPETGRQFRVAELTADVSGLYEVRTGVVVETQTVMNFEVEIPGGVGSLGSSPTVQASLIMTRDTRFDRGSLETLGCG